MNSTITVRSSYPVSLEEAKIHCRVDDDRENDLLSRLITAATLMVESLTGRCFSTGSTAVGRYEEISEVMPLGYSPVSAITSIVYTLDDSTLTLSASDYTLDNSWPTPRVLVDDIPDHDPGVTVTYTCGEVNSLAKTAILFLVGHWYANREAVVIGTINSETNLAFNSIINILTNRGIC